MFALWILLGAALGYITCWYRFSTKIQEKINEYNKMYDTAMKLSEMSQVRMDQYRSDRNVH